MAFEAQHQHGRGVAAADQAEAVGKVHAQTVDGAHLTAFKLQAAIGHTRQQLGDHGVVFTFCARHVEFGRGEAGGQGIQKGAGVLFAAQDLQQAAGGVHGVVKAVPAFAEEQVAAHLAGKGCPDFLELGLDQRVPGLPQHGLATRLADGHRQPLAALDVKDDGSALVALEDVAREQHDLPVGVDDVALRRDHAQAITVTVKGQAHFGTGGLDDLDQVGQVLGLAGIGVVVRKVAVDLGIQVDDVTAQGAQDGRGRCTRDAVAAVHHDLHRPRQLAVAGDAVGVFGADVHLGATPALGGVGLGFDARLELLNVVAVDGAAAHHHLEAVVILRVVAAGDLDAAGAAVLATRSGHVVQHGGGDGADVHHVQPGALQPLDQAGHQGWARQAPVAPHGHGLFARSHTFGAKGPAQVFGKGRVDVLADDAADVIGLEDGGIDLHAGALLAEDNV